ncbi:MAG: hypothetical protein HY849_02025, partial [Nitrosomonadales bacterium]|nr:hypothetical protein [Nitrosomonadales bacterium]
KRLAFGIPEKQPPGVKELWSRAPIEAQQRAHQTCVQILAMWLGKRDREAVAKELSIPPLRVWQLSQQALSGMLAGLLKQPRSRRGRPAAEPIVSEDDPRLLKKKIETLEQRVRDRDELVRLLSQLPRPTSGPPESNSTAKGRRGAKRRDRVGGQVPGDEAPKAR